MNITNLPQEPIIDPNSKNEEGKVTGHISTGWRIFFNQIVNQSQEFLSDERYKLPSQPAKANTTVSDLNTIKSEGGILYDNIEKVGKINTEDGYNTPKTYSFKTLVTYEELTQAQVNAIPSGQRNGRIIFETDTGDTKLGTNNTFITL